jgi:hypothetical protein
MLRSGNAKVTVTTEEACASHDLPNSIATIFPNNATGVLNATLVIVPISLDDARRLIPAQYGILEHAYRSLLPDFPEGMYPMLVQAAHDHDIQLQAYGITLEDFSVRLRLLPPGAMTLTLGRELGLSFRSWIYSATVTRPSDGHQHS